MSTRGSNSWRLAEWGPPCVKGGAELIVVPIYAGGPKVQVRREMRDSVLQLGAIFLKHGYVVRRIGGYNCRAITGGSSYSSHSWGISVDVNDDTNPYRLDKVVTDMPWQLIQSVYDLTTRDGVQVWRWGGDWDGDPDTRNSNYDAMHFECIATPAELARGFVATVPVVVPVDVPVTPVGIPHSALEWPVLRHGSDGPAVIELQRLLSLGNTTGVGHFGPRTEEAVKAYQRNRGMVVDGIVGHATWTALLTEQPHDTPIPPQKQAGLLAGAPTNVDNWPGVHA